MSSGTEKRQRNKLLPPVRCTEDELDAVKASALSAGRSVSDLIRRQIIEKARSGPKPRKRRPTPDIAMLARLLAELGKIGSNVNQLARTANISAALPELDHLAEIHSEIRAIRDALMRALGHGD